MNRELLYHILSALALKDYFFIKTLEIIDFSYVPGTMFIGVKKGGIHEGKRQWC